MIQAALELVARFIFSVLLSLAELPVFFVLATPFILLRSVLWPGHIRRDFAAVYNWWDRWTMALF